MPSELTTIDLALDPQDNERLANLCGPFDEHLRQLELRLGVEISNRGSLFRIVGTDYAAGLAEKMLREAYALTETETLSAAALNVLLQESGVEALAERAAAGAQNV